VAGLAWLVNISPLQKPINVSLAIIFSESVVFSSLQRCFYDLPTESVFYTLIVPFWLAIPCLFAICQDSHHLPHNQPRLTATAVGSNMSLQYLGISHFPVLHRQFSSPTKGAFPDSSPSQQDLTQDSKDVLIERLNDLVLRLSTAQELEDGAVTAVHSQVDRIEMILRGEAKHKQPNHSRSGSGISVPKDDPFWGPATPTQSMKMRLPNTSTDGQRPPLRRNLQQVSSAKAKEMAQAAEDLASRMTVTLEEFQRRKEESDVGPRKVLCKT
jgi:hypothetical protein